MFWYIAPLLAASVRSAAARAGQCAQEGAKCSASEQGEGSTLLQKAHRIERPSGSCVEAVLVEPRRIAAIRLALETASLARSGPDMGAGPAIQVLTMMHGSDNEEYVRRLV